MTGGYSTTPLSLKFWGLSSCPLEGVPQWPDEDLGLYPAVKELCIFISMARDFFRVLFPICSRGGLGLKGLGAFGGRSRAQLAQRVVILCGIQECTFSAIQL